jgi:hypothetical protein
MTNVVDECAIIRPKARPVTLRRAWLFRVIFIVYVLLLGEIGARVYWHLVRRVSITDPDGIWHSFYPEVARHRIRRREAAARDGGSFDVLLLGGSVLHENYGTIGEDLRAALASRLGRDVRVFNLAYPARTSRDSLLKFRRLTEEKYDLVVFYHGINDTRMNNCPKTLFRDDYRHAAWYDKVDAFGSRSQCFLLLPFTMTWTKISLLESGYAGMYVPRLNPRPAWVNEGADIKTATAFRNHAREIIAGAKRQGAQVLLMSFAYHFPRDASGRLLPEGPEHYASGVSVAGIWGLAENVAQGIDVHNAIIQELVREDPTLLYVDQHRLMPKNAVTFHDCCHMTAQGGARFVENILSSLGDRLDPVAARSPPTRR